MLYREDADEVRARLTEWWNGGDIGRPAIMLTAGRETPLERFPEMPKPAGAGRPTYTAKSLEYRVNVAQRYCIGTYFLGEEMPTVSPDLAPNCLALFLGCQGVETETTVWCEPCFEAPGQERFEYDPRNFYWSFCRRLCAEQLRVGAGKFLVAFPDLIEGLDTLSAMRGNEKLLYDLIERPEWVKACLRQITDRYFHYYDILYDMIRDEVGGSHFWAWAPGRMAKFQCDFAAMISPAMFGEFMVPVLREMCERVSYCMFHWDGPGALPHLDHLLSIPKLTMIQWTPGAGVEPVDHERWWPLYHRMVEGGKKPILLNVRGAESLERLKKEFGPKLKNFMLKMHAKTKQEAESWLRIAAGGR